jgi:hypothetical protein
MLAQRHQPVHRFLNIDTLEKMIDWLEKDRARCDRMKLVRLAGDVDCARE